MDGACVLLLGAGWQANFFHYGLFGALHPYEPSSCWPIGRLPQVESIVLSIISMLSSPNDESPANIDAAKQWREDRDGFKKKVARIVRKSQEML